VQSEFECGPHSDSSSGKSLGQVRMRASFGQRKQDKAGTSPNASMIRTVRAGKAWAESECVLHSDSSSGKSLGQVRMRASFGQRKQDKWRTSPNASLIRTAQQDKAGTSPNASLIRTAQQDKAGTSPNASPIRTARARKVGTQSECEPHSDSSTQKNHNPVRTPAGPPPKKQRICHGSLAVFL
jgi:hypothetical protein